MKAIMSPLSEQKLSLVSDIKSGTEEHRLSDNHMKTNIKKSMVNNKTTIATFTAIVSAIVLSTIIRSSGADIWHQRTVLYVSFTGDIVLQMLKCLIIPLVVSSVVTSLGKLRTGLTTRIAWRTVFYFICTNVTAIFLGLVLVLIIRPGSQNLQSVGQKFQKWKNITPVDALLDVIRNIFPSNIIQATFQQYSTNLVPNNSSDISQWRVEGKYETSGPNSAGLIIIAIVLGIVLSQMKSKGKPLYNVFECLSDVSLRISQLIMKLVPLGVFCLILARSLSVDVSLLDSRIGLFALTVITGLLIHGLIILPAIHYTITRRNPFSHILAVSQALLTAFGTSSSSATLPATIDCLESKAQINSNVAKLCATIGSTFNMDGTSLYEIVAAVFIAQSRGVDMGFGNVLLASVAALIVSLSTTGLPSGGIISMAVVLNAFGLSGEELGLIIAIDWILDRMRTTINVLSDTFGAVIIEHLVEDELRSIDSENELYHESIRKHTIV